MTDAEAWRRYLNDLDPSTDSIRLGWAETRRVKSGARDGDVVATFTLGAGDVHAVRPDEDFAICGAAIVWPERPSRPPATCLPSFACVDCQALWPLFARLMASR